MNHALCVCLIVLLAALGACTPSTAQDQPAHSSSPEMQAAIARLSAAGVLPGKKGSLTFYRWSNAQPPQLVRLGLWGPKIDNELLALVKTMPNLEAVSLYETSVDDAGAGALAELPKLKMLAVLPVERYEKQGFGPTQWSYPFIPRRAERPRITGKLLAALAEVKTLESLDLQDALVQPRELALLASWPQLRSLGLPNVIDDETVQSLQACRKLSQLTLGNREITAAELRRLAACQSLRRLALSCATLSGEALAALSSLATVDSIELIDCGLTDRHLQYLRVSPQLRELALPRNEINGPGLAHLTQLKIKALGLEFNNVRDETLSDVAQLRGLEEVRLSYCLGVTNRGLHSGALQSMPQLKRLAFRGVPAITNESLDDLAKFKSLEHLNIRSNGITRDGWERLKRSLPQTVVFR